MSRTHGARFTFVVMAASSMLAISGCATSPSVAGSTDGSPEPVSSPTTAAGGAVSGVGPTGFPGVEFPIPADARSVVVDFVCHGGGSFSVELGDSMMLGQAMLGGVCDGGAELSWPVTERTGPTLSVHVGDDVEWVATPAFSTEEFATDAATAADCERFIDIFSALANADAGFSTYRAFDEAEWGARVDGAAVELDALAASAASALRDSFVELSGAVSDPARSPGAVLVGPAADHIAAISQVCDANQTPLHIRAEFGG
ncbi:hypothetical protein [Microbacterium oleivorans]|uniref:Uncharacterized protein n=1 Tax=Microbacterium oleivorans TaxID=273677 RepID=A0A7D5EWF2_9MICO|nr:hypothetical protein [Microbacterium oleivorans]QLD11506.1 hypothetical protein HW566_06805 [Microbacterium oleivorans]